MKRAVAFKTTMIATSICLLFLLGGSVLLSMFHIDLALLSVAGGIILFLYAIQMVMEEPKEGDNNSKPKKVSPSVAISPLAMPFMATPQALVAITTLSAGAPEVSGKLMLFAVIVAIALLDLIFMLNVEKIMKFAGREIIQIIAKIAGILLLALATQMIVGGLADGLANLGLIPAY
ncbi:MarC family protein [Vibrio sp. SS-MA-C1-2]|uniref:MarC family protein n=1 Tax=Vibrio sp. SS-MA-C1-2 TaxID=2908646 RepID=UPI001F29D589|nr:MarC family protein [Vibrio sp. SS-MA-C1-2]UJF16908.1 MarC family protein [Vibrio sp. SS-MA-C1-2]